MKKILLIGAIALAIAQAGTLEECKILEKKLNVNWTMKVAQKFIDLDCDRVLGESTREARVKEIREAAKELQK